MLKKLTVGMLIIAVTIFSICVTPEIDAIANESVLSKDLQGDFQGDEMVDVMVFLHDVAYDDVIREFATRYPDECALYVQVKENAEPDVLSESDANKLQAAIEHKRDIYRNFYKELNGKFYCEYEKNAECIFQSQYSPMIILRTTYSIVEDMAQNDQVEWITRFYDCKIEDEGLETANVFSRADYVRDVNANRGSGVKIGMIEENYPTLEDDYLASANIHLRTNEACSDNEHAIIVARILVGTLSSSRNTGVAPDAELFCCKANGTAADFYDGVEWLISQNVNIINMSMYLSSGGNVSHGVYDIPSKWVDHIAVTHDVHVVKSSGNRGESDKWVTSPGMAYNAITVGAYKCNGASQWNGYNSFEMACSSSYLESGSGRAEKPNIVAYGENFWTMHGDSASGTSFSAPQVTGVIAQLCSYNASLKVQQTKVGAILMAAAVHKIDATNSGCAGSTFSTAVRVNNMAQISNKEGAGILDARWAREIVANGKCWNPTVYDDGFPYNKTITISANENSVIRVCIFWLRQNSVSNPHATGSVSTGTMSNLDLYILNPSGSIAAASTTTMGNFEIVQFTPHMTGTYTIQIRDLGGHSGKDYIGIAMWSGNIGD